MKLVWSNKSSFQIAFKSYSTYYRNRLSIACVLCNLSTRKNVNLFAYICLSCRCVDNEQRHLALGLTSFIVRLLGSIPGPLIAGALFDSSCLLRNSQQEECGLIGNCLLFDNFLLSVYSMALCISGLGVSAVFSFLTWLSYPKSKVTQ